MRQLKHKQYTTESWTGRAAEVHDGFFDYSDTIYINSYHKVTIICPIHGMFEADPISHMRGSKCCPGCRHNMKLTQKGFIDRCLIIHPNLDFSKSVFINTRTKVKVVCPDHGDFYKEPRFLLSSDNPWNGCPICRSLSNDKHPSTWNRLKLYQDNEDLGSEDGVFYKLLVTHKETGIKFIKIGITSYTSYQRYNNSKYRGFVFEVIEEVFDTNLNCAIKEEIYKKKNTAKRIFLPDYIEFAGRSECYEYDEVYQLKYNQIKFIRDGLLERQNGICPICNNLVTMPTLDHSHIKKNYGTGRIRGVLCNTCNRFLGAIENRFLMNNIQLSDAIDTLQRTVEYLRLPHQDIIHPTDKPKDPKLSKRCFNRLNKEYRAKYPKRKPLVYPKSKKLTKVLNKVFEELSIDIVYL